MKKTALGARCYKYYEVDFSTAGYSTAPPITRTHNRESEREAPLFSLFVRAGGIHTAYGTTKKN